MRVGDIRHPERLRFGKPLDGVRVLALEQMQALPYATQLLAHLGADVVKVEPPGTGDTGRASAPALVDDDGRRVGATYLRNNLGKRSIAVDLKQEAGRELVRRLIPHFDVVAENFKPGVLRRFGLDYESVAALAPRAIYVSVSGFGHTAPTPYGSWPAYAPVVEAMAGLYEPNREGRTAAARRRRGRARRHRERALRRDRRSCRRCATASARGSASTSTSRCSTRRSRSPTCRRSCGRWARPSRGRRPGKLGICAGFRGEGRLVRDRGLPRAPLRAPGARWWAIPSGWATRASRRARAGRSTPRPWCGRRSRRGRATRRGSRRATRSAREGIVAGPNHTAADLAADPHVAARDMLHRGAAPRRRARHARRREPGEALARRGGAGRDAFRASASTRRRCCARPSASATRSSRGFARREVI